MEELRLKMIQSFIDEQYREKNRIEEEAIKDYMDKNNLTIEDIKKYGVVEHYPESKTIYRYKNEIICEIILEIPYYEDILNA